MNSHLTPSASVSRSLQNVDNGKINSSYVTRGTRDMCITPREDVLWKCQFTCASTPIYRSTITPVNKHSFLLPTTPKRHLLWLSLTGN